ncbi:ribonuclease H-like domain-containing protein [Rhizophagus irregularis DAOM 181602=DAOM 197198]|nr:ribonuclease H-like domain-containing protein [Rhizophagus irregularis DAOM 181602=DAOM 197198]
MEKDSEVNKTVETEKFIYEPSTVLGTSPLSPNSQKGNTQRLDNFEARMDQAFNIRPSIDGIIDINNTFKITTINVSGLNTTLKQEQVLNYMKINKISCLIITETKLQTASAKMIYKDYKDITTWWLCDSDNYFSTEVGIIMNNDYAKYVIKKDIIEGRALKLTLLLKEKIRFTIIAIYNFSNNSYKDKILEFYTKLEEILTVEKKLQAKIVCVRDFNASYNTAIAQQRANQKIFWKDHIFQILKKNVMVNINLIHQDKPLNIWNRSDKKSRINYIWVTKDLVPDTIYKKHNNNNLKVDYKKIDSQLWETYAEKIEKLLDKEKDIIDNVEILINNINRIWNTIRDTFKKANSELPKKKGNLNKEVLSKTIVFYKRFLHKLSYILTNLTEKKIISLNLTNYRECKIFIGKHYETISEICFKFTIDIDRLLDKNIKEFKEIVKIAFKLVQANFAEENKIYKEEKMKFYIQQRSEDLQDNKKRFLDFTLNRKRSKIILDKIVIEKNSVKQLISDEELIENELIEHFRSFAEKKLNSNEKLKGRWICQYSPKQDINECWYNEVIQPITNLCLQVGDIPEKWKHALLYPIPKTMDWEYSLIKTRPIILLETLRKVVVKIVTKRLSKVIAERNILKGGNHARLPGGSTEAPLRIINTCIEDAKKNNKELYKKSVIKEKGITKQYTSIIGIDQGEVISPLLWTIYYDPLLAEINSVKMGYEIEHCFKSNVQSDQEEKLRINISSQSYMDDVTRITKNKAQSSKRMVKPLTSKESVRILGVWINLDLRTNYVFNQYCKQLQSELLSNKSPLATWNISLKDLQVKHCLLAHVLALLYDNMLTIKSSGVKVNQIQGGLIPIVEICTHKEIFTNGISKELKGKNVYFASQLMLSDGTRILRYKDLKHRTKINTQGYNIHSVDTKIDNLKTKNWITTFHDQMGKPIIGRVLDNPNEDKIRIEHWIQNLENDQISPSVQCIADINIENCVKINANLIQNDRYIADIAIYEALAQAECKYYRKTSMNECIIEKVNGLFKYIHPSDYRNALIEIANSLTQETDIEIYTDESMKNVATNEIMMDNPSSNKAELMAVILSLMICPKAANVEIYSDSQWIIRIYSLKVKITKVKVHSDYDYNKEADKLAKSDAEKNVLIIEDKLLLHNGNKGRSIYRRISNAIP